MNPVHGRDILGVKRLGLFGGTFDPVHLGHLHAARTARAEFDLDGVLFVPAARSPHKSGAARASSEDRLAMLELALADEPRFDCSELELSRGAPSYTIDTVRDLLQRRAGIPGAELFLILGSDNLEALDTWREVEQLLLQTTPVIVARKGRTMAALERCEGLSAELLERLRRGFIDAETVDVSATDLRSALETGGADSKLPASVREYISERGIYAKA